MKKTMLTFLLLLMLITQSLFAEADRYAGLKAELTGYIEQEMKKQKIAGISLALVDDNEIVWTEGFGYADVKGKVPVDEQTVFSLASISKLFTGMAIMKLVEEGKIDLDSPLSTYIPEFSIKSRFPESEVFTIRNMLTHHSGLPGDLFNGGTIEFSPEAVEQKNHYEEMLLDFLKTVHLHNRPEYVQAYSNIAYDLLLLVVERVTGMEFNDFVTEHIFAPMGMTNASFEELFSRSELGEAMALPHKKMKPAEKLLFLGTGSGALNASVTNIGNFIKVMLAKGQAGERSVIAAETLEQMWTVQNKNVALDREVKMGLSFFLNDRELDYAGRFYGHGGNLRYYHSSLKVLPDHGLGVIVTTNSNSGSGFVFELAQMILKKSLLEKKGIAPPQVEPPKPVTMSQELAKELEGLYATVMAGPVELNEKRGKLFARLFGVKVRVELLENGWLRPKTFIKGLKKMNFKIEKIEDKRRLYVRTGPYSMLLGEEYELCELNMEKWEKWLGSYVEFDRQTGEVKKKSKEPKISYIDGKLLLDTGLYGVVLLNVISDNECLIAGVGRAAGETVYFIDDEEEPYIRVSDFTLIRKK